MAEPENSADSGAQHQSPILDSLRVSTGLERWIADHVLHIISAVMISSIVCVVAVAGMYFVWWPWIPSSRPAWGVAGDFLGGVLNPILTFLSLVALLATIVLQSVELREARNEAKRSREAQENSEKALRDQADILQTQLNDSRVSIKTSGFLEGVKLVQGEEIRDARRRVCQLYASNVSFGSWTEADHRAAGLVCQSFDILGMMIREGMAPKEIFARNWNSSIRKCWIATQEYIEDRKRNDGNNWAFSFEWLQNEAEKADNTSIVFYNRDHSFWEAPQGRG